MTAGRGRRGAAIALAVATMIGAAALSVPGAVPQAAAQQTATQQPAPPQAAPEQGAVGQGAVEQRGPVTNLPLPRYVSLKGSEGNARRGPSLSHRIDWVFRHAGMPLRVTAEFGHWRRVEDKDGAGGWVHYALLSGVRTVLVTQDMLELRTRPQPDADIVARAEAGAILRLNECQPDWCRVSGGGQRGWVPKPAIWGVEPDEVRD